MYDTRTTQHKEVRQSDACWRGHEIATLIMMIWAGLAYWSRHVRFVRGLQAVLLTRYDGVIWICPRRCDAYCGLLTMCFVLPWLSTSGGGLESGSVMKHRNLKKADAGSTAGWPADGPSTVGGKSKNTLGAGWWATV